MTPDFGVDAWVRQVARFARRSTGPGKRGWQVVARAGEATDADTARIAEVAAFLGGLCAPDAVTKAHRPADAPGYDFAALLALVVRSVLETGKLTSWPAPANRQHGEVINRWIVIDMFTKSLTGTPVKAAIAEAVSQLKQIYG